MLADPSASSQEQSFFYLLIGSHSVSFTLQAVVAAAATARSSSQSACMRDLDPFLVDLLTLSLSY